MRNIVFILILVVTFSVACQRIDTPYAGIADTESDKTALQPDPARIK